MLCSQCQANPATLRFEAVINGQKTAANLCSNCAQKTGLGSAQGGEAGAVNFPPLPPALAALFGALSHWTPPALPAADACPRCRWTLRDFQRTGKMGCPECYVHFHRATERILEEIQGAVTHAGRRPAAR
jgi:protein arginine kinase activator